MNTQIKAMIDKIIDNTPRPQLLGEYGGSCAALIGGRAERFTATRLANQSSNSDAIIAQRAAGIAAYEHYKLGASGAAAIDAGVHAGLSIFKELSKSAAMPRRAL